MVKIEIDIVKYSREKSEESIGVSFNNKMYKAMNIVRSDFNLPR